MFPFPFLSSPFPSPLHSLPFSVPIGFCPYLALYPFLSFLCSSLLLSTPFFLPLNVLISEGIFAWILEVICKSCACRLGLVRLHAFTRQRTKDSKPSFCNVLDGHTQPTENCFQNVIVSLLGKNWVKSQFLKPCNSLGNMPSLRTSKMEYTFFGLGNCAFGSGEINAL